MKIPVSFFAFWPRLVRTTAGFKKTCRISGVPLGEFFLQRGEVVEVTVP